MRKIVVFGEDYGHEEVVRALVRRIANELGLMVDVQALSTRGGHGPMLRELKEYTAEMSRSALVPPDMLVVARDANCQGATKCRNEIRKAAGDFSGALVEAIPNPHVERWLLLDTHAFKSVLGVGCSPPDLKCDRDRYKQILDEAIRQAGIEPLFGGLEFAAKIVDAMNLNKMRKTADLGKTIQSLQVQMRQWHE